MLNLIPLYLIEPEKGDPERGYSSDLSNLQGLQKNKKRSQTWRVVKPTVHGGKMRERCLPIICNHFIFPNNLERFPKDKNIVQPKTCELMNKLHKNNFSSEAPVQM